METKPQTPEIFLIDILHKVGINCDTLNNLVGLCISRDTLLVYKTYEDVKEYIPKLKLIFSTSYLTSLQTTAEKTQKWPLINLLRQVLRTYNYQLIPKRLCDGYTKDGKKKYKRIFTIERLYST